jgi:hypothetical protein
MSLLCNGSFARLWRKWRRPNRTAFTTWVAPRRTQKKEETKKAILTSSNTRAMQPKMQAAELPYIVVIEP